MSSLRLCVTTIILLLSVTCFAQTGELLSRTFKPARKSASIEYYLEAIKKETGVEISWSSSHIKEHKRVQLKGNEQTINDVLNTILEGEHVKVMERNGKILLVPTETSSNTAPRSCTINGFIRDLESKEVLIGAYVIAPSLKVGTVTNTYGFYSLTLPPGQQEVLIAYVGYKADTLRLSLNGDVRKDVQLNNDALLQVEIVDREQIESLSDHVHLTINDINSHQALLGENDVMRALQQIPGVQSGIDGGTSVMVRGGEPGQNLNLLDGSPLYFIDHFFGVSSVYNTDAIKSVDFHKGAFPARYGGRLSSIIDVHTRDGDMERFGGQASIGLVKGSLNLEGPIIKNKASVMLSARRTWIDALIRPETDNQVGIDFYDVNLKTNVIINKNNRLYLSLYNGRDMLESSDETLQFNIKWRNTLGSARWSTVVSPKLFVHTSVTFSQFRFSARDQALSVIDTSIVINSYEASSRINDICTRVQANWYANATHSVQMGASYTVADFIPMAVVNTFDNQTSGAQPEKTGMNEVSFYVEDEITLGEKWKLRGGIHWANWFSKDYDYSSIQPRIYASYQVAKGHTIHASFSQMAQFLHLVNSSSIGLPTEFWIPSTKRILPEEALQGTLGYSAKVGNMEYSIEGYYKDIHGVTMYTAGSNMFDNSSHWQDKMIQGKGWCYGAEFFAAQKIGKFYATTAYTLSWNWRQFDEVNDGKMFPARYDRRHVIKLSLTFKPNQNMDIGSNWTYMSGEAITLPDQVYTDLDGNMMISNPNGFSQFTYYYSDWNKYRLPSIHRLDVGANFRKRKGKHYMRTWSLGVFNAYGRKNVMFVTPTMEGSTEALTGISLFRFTPYITYKVNF